MINKKNRFHGYTSVRRVYRHGKTVRIPFVALKYGLNERRRIPRVAVVVSKKVNKSAVVRNRIRRRVYEVVRHCLEPEIPAYDLVFTVFNDKLAAMTAEELEKTIKSLLKDVIKTEV
jgi:ribonuclease P protein component